MYRTIVLGAALALAFPAWATDIYRCTDTQGRVEYRDAPCSRALGQTGSAITLPPLNFVREVDQSAARAAADALSARTAERARREEQLRTGSAGVGAGIPLWQVPGGLPVQGQPEVHPKPPVPTPTPEPPASLPTNATSAAAAAAMGNPALPPSIPPQGPVSLPANATSAAAAAAIGNPALPSVLPPKAPPSMPVNPTSGAVAGATGVAGK